jgi:hypothetical protein
MPSQSRSECRTPVLDLLAATHFGNAARDDSRRCFSVWHNISGSIVANLMVSKAEKKAESGFQVIFSQNVKTSFYKSGNRKRMPPAFFSAYFLHF